MANNGQNDICVCFCVITVASLFDVFCRNYSTRYRPELDLVLKDISVAIVCQLEDSGGLIGLNFAFNRAQVKKLVFVEGPAPENHRLGFFLSLYLPFS